MFRKYFLQEILCKTVQARVRSSEIVSSLEKPAEVGKLLFFVNLDNIHYCPDVCTEASFMSNVSPLSRFEFQECHRRVVRSLQ